MIQRTRLKTGLAATASLLAMLVPALAFAEDAPAPTLSSGDTAWMLTSTALVLLMTIPGLSLFYAGMVRSKNALSVMVQCFVITCLVTVLWVVISMRSRSVPTSAASSVTSTKHPQRRQVRHAERGRFPNRCSPPSR